MPNSYVSQIELIAAITTFLEKKCGVTAMLSREFNTVIRCATEIVDELAKPERPVVAGMGLYAWLNCDHTGVSSEFMAGVLSGKFSRKFGHPHDPDDFKRCLWLLDACPELRENLSRLSEHGPEWAALVANWDELEALFCEEFPTGKAPRLAAMISELFKKESLDD